jgi:hypothetical protein
MRSFVHLGSSQFSNNSEDLESDEYTSSPPSPQRSSGRESQGVLAAFLDRVNAAIEHATTRIARATCDQVDGSEEGLLLPVRKGVEEGARPTGVMAGVCC